MWARKEVLGFSSSFFCCSSLFSPFSSLVLGLGFLGFFPSPLYLRQSARHSGRFLGDTAAALIAAKAATVARSPRGSASAPAAFAIGFAPLFWREAACTSGPLTEKVEVVAVGGRNGSRYNGSNFRGGVARRRNGAGSAWIGTAT